MAIPDQISWLGKYTPSTLPMVSNAKLFIRVFSYSSREDLMLMTAAVVASIGAGATLPLMNIIFARLVNTFTIQATAASFMSVIDKYVLYILYLFIGRCILAYIAIFGFRSTSLRISAAIRLHYLKALFQQPISTLDALPNGQTSSIITITANVLQLGISERLSSLIQAIAVISVALIIGCIYSWALTLATASGLVVITLWYSVTTPLLVRKCAAVQEMEMESSGLVSETLLNIRMVAACEAEEKMARRYNTLIEEARIKSRELSPLLALQHSPVFFTIFATFALCFWFAVKLYLHFKFANVQSLVVVLMSIMTMIAHLSAISVPLTAASNALNAASIFFTIIDAPKPDLTGAKDAKVSMNSNIELKHVNFTYPSRHDVRVLENFSLHIPAGKITAVVGSSGSGKSTVVALISRWYELGEDDTTANYLRNGDITFGGRSLNSIDLCWWRSQLGLVQQEPFLFNDTIFRNVEYGLVNTEHEHASEQVKRVLVEQACKDAYADEFIHDLPEGYHTQVGEVGLQLSGGQRQRIVIARAIVRNPKILIFDEATSALDVTSERIVQAALAKASQGRTTIVIAHRLSTIKVADQIAVVSEGRVLQLGTHENLLEDIGGAYWKLVNAQQIVAHIPGPATDMFWSEKSEMSYPIEEESLDSIFATEHNVRGGLEHRMPSELPKVCANDPMPTKVKTVKKGLGNGTVSNIFRSFGMLLCEQKRNWVGYALMLTATAGAGSSSPIQAYLFARLISGFAYWGEQLRDSTSFLCLMLLVVAIGVGSSYFVLGWLSNNISADTVSFYRREYFHNIITKPIDFFDDHDHSSGLLTARITTDPTQLQQLLGNNMAMVMISIFNIVGCITIAIFFHWKFALVVIISSLPVILASGWYRVRYEVRFEARNNKVFAESARFATEAIGAIRTVVSLTLERTICDRYEEMLNTHVAETWKDARVSCMVFALSDSMVLLCMAFALWYGGTLLATGSLQSFNFLVVYLAIIQGSLAAGQWLSFGPNIAQVSAAANRIQLMRITSDQSEDFVTAKHIDGHHWKLPTSLLWKGADIEFRDVWFKYPTRNVTVLRGCSFKIQHGQFAAIVGSSGAGKTSVVSLLERFYEPQGGTICYNDEDIASIPIGVLRKRMSLVAQEASIFRGTIRDNVLLGVDKENDIPEEVLQRACRDAGIHDFVSSLPDGYNTNVGTSGVSLSGGQRQRISIARALIRDPSVLLLDEATSSLDSETEKEVQAVFEHTAKGRTMIVVAHRLATVQNADVIFVMHHGRVLETGHHRSLLAKKGMYWQMCEAQALGH